MNYPFRETDPDKRLRVQAIIQKTLNEAPKLIDKQNFAVHLANSRTQSAGGNVLDRKKTRMINKRNVVQDYYEKRDIMILNDPGFDIKAERDFQEKMHAEYKNNDPNKIHEGWLPIVEELNKNKQIWDGLVLVMAIFNSFAVPLEYVITDLSKNSTYQVIDLVINIMFIFDILLGFRTTYFDALGQEIRDPKQISTNYLRGMFIIDLLSSIPYRYAAIVMPFFDYISFFKILKIARISRFAPFVQKLELDEGDKASLKIF